MSEDTTEGGRKITRRSVLAGLAATVGSLLLKPNISIQEGGQSPKFDVRKLYNIRKIFEPNIVELNDRKLFLDHLRRFPAFESSLSDEEISTFSIHTFAIHKAKDADLIYPKFAILPPLKNSPDQMPRIIMQREGLPVQLSPTTTLKNGINIISWHTLIFSNNPDVHSVLGTNDSDIVLAYSDKTIPREGEKTSSSGDNKIYYFPSDFLTGNREDIEGIDFSKLPEQAKKYLSMSVSNLKR